MGCPLLMSAISGNLSKLISVYYLNEEGTQGVQDPPINLNNFLIYKEFRYEQTLSYLT